MTATLYMTKRNGGVEYTYEPACAAIKQGASWSAKVRRDGHLVGEPKGTIDAMPAGSTYVELAHAYIRSWIEWHVRMT